MNFFEIAALIVGSLFVAGLALGFLIIEVLPGACDDEQPPPRWPGS